MQTTRTYPLPRKLLPSVSSASAQYDPLQFELSIASTELRVCSDCDKVLFEPRQAQPHRCKHEHADAGKTQSKQPRSHAKSPSKKRRTHKSRTQSELKRKQTEPTRTPTVAKRLLPKLTDVTGTFPATPTRKTPTARLPDLTRTIPKALDKFRKQPNTETPPRKHEHVRLFTSKPESFRTVTNSAEVTRSAPSTPDPYRQVPSGAEQFRPATCSPEALLGAKSNSPTSLMRDAIGRLASEMRARRPLGGQRCVEAADPKQPSTMSGFAADVLFAAGNSFRGAPHFGKSKLNSEPGSFLNRQQERAMMNKFQRTREALAVEVCRMFIGVPRSGNPTRHATDFFVN